MHTSRDVTSFSAIALAGIIILREKAGCKQSNKNERQKLATCFATLPQNALNSDVARFTTHELSLFCNKSGGCRFRKVVAESRE